jgi:cell division protein FtsB
MKAYHILLSSCLTIFLYFSLQAIWGPAGMQACSDLNQYKNRLAVSIDQLREFEMKLSSDLTRLETDPSRLQQEAYRIGLVGSNEIRIRIPEIPSSTMSAPTVIAQRPVESAASQAIISGVSISVGLVLLFFLVFLNFEVDIIFETAGSGRKKMIRRPV